MPETYSDLVNRVMRDHEGYTGDGRGGAGDLPVGDTSTARKPINKRDLREVLLSGETAVQTAVDAAAQASLDAATAEQAMLDVQGATLYAADLPALLANTDTHSVGTVFGTRKEGYAFEVVGSASDQVTAGGVHLRRVRQDELALQSEEAAAAGPASAKADDLRARWQNTAPLIWSKVERVKPEWGGARGVNTNHIATAGALQAAADFCAREGKVLHLSKEAEYGIGTAVALPAGTRVQNDGAAIIGQYTPADHNVAFVTLGAGCDVDMLTVRTAAGRTSWGRAIAVQGGGRIGTLAFEALGFTANGSAIPDYPGAIIFTGNDTCVDVLDIKNVANSWVAYQANGLQIGFDRASGINRGGLIRESAQVHCRGGDVAHAIRAYNVGDYSLHISGASSCTFRDYVSRDAASHAFRIGGALSGESFNLDFENLTALRPRGCGFKSQPEASQLNRNITVRNLQVEDCGAGTTEQQVNTSALRMVSTSDIRIDGYTNRIRGQAFSGWSALRFEGCNRFYAHGIMSDETSSDGVVVSTSIPEGGSREITDFELQFMLTRPGGAGFRMRPAVNGDVIRRGRVDMKVSAAAGAGMEIENRPDGTAGMSTSPTGNGSLLLFRGAVADCSPNKSVPATYSSLSRFVDEVISV